MSENYRVGLDITDFQDNGKRRPISRVTLLVDGENAVTAGDDTGLAITADCPYATQEMADAVLSQVKGYEYQAFTAGAANLDPAAELGDSITTGGIYSVIGALTDRGDGYPDVSAPGEAELEDEYPSAGPMTQEINWKIAETRSAITKTAEEIRLEVQNEMEGLSASFSVELEAVTGRVEDTESGLSQTLRIAADGVTITNAAGDTLTIDGGQIDASKIHAEELDASRIRVSDLQLSGAITWSDLSQDVQGDINSAGNLAVQAINQASTAQGSAQSAMEAISGWTYSGTTYIDGQKIMTGTVRASSLEGGQVLLLDQSMRTAGSFTLTGASSYLGAKVVMESGAIELSAMFGDIYLSSASRYFAVTSFLSCGGDLAPSPSGAFSCGMPGQVWSDVYAQNSTIQTSDRRKKTDITYGLARYDAFFDALRPASFRLTDGQSGRTHAGFIAQDVEEALCNTGLTSQEFAGFIRYTPHSGEKDPETYEYALRYGEFLPLAVWQIQRLKERVQALESACAGEGETSWKN